MDTPTHGFIGRLVARSIWPEERGLVNLVTVASMLPDLDVLIPGDALEGLRTHRGISHSFLGIGIGAAAVAWAVRRFVLQEISFSRLYAVSLLGLLLHVVFDVVTSYGTMVFSPFSDYRALFDVLFIIDPYLDLILFGGLLLGWWRIGRWGYRIGLVALTVYMAVNIAVTGVSVLYMDRWAEREGLVVEQVAAVPVPFSPLHRRGIVRSEGVWYDVPVSLFDGANGRAVSYPSALSDARLGALWERREGQIYRWFARFPVVTSGTEEEVVVQDLRFLMRPDGLGWLGSLAAKMAVDHSPEFFDRRVFSLEITLDDDGRLEQVIYTGGSIDGADEE